MNSFELTCFGTGDGWPCADRNHSSFLYRFGKTSFIIDCGESVSRAYKSSGLDYDAFDALLLSHLHCDHIGGFFMFMQGMWLEGRRKPLKVYLPGTAINPLREMLTTVFLSDEVLPFRLQLLALEGEKSVKVRDARITPFYTTHVDGTRARFEKKYRADFSAYCFLIEHQGVRIGHSADLGQPEDLELLVEKRLDLLVCELSHFTPEEIFSYLRNRPVKQIAFVHIARAYRKNLPALRRLARKQIPNIRCDFPDDGDEVIC